MMIVLSSWPMSVSAWMSAATASSTACSDSSCFRSNASWFALLVRAPRRDRLHPGRLVGDVGLVVVRRPPGRDGARTCRRGAAPASRARAAPSARSRGRTAAALGAVVDELHREVAQHVGRVVGVGAAVRDLGAVVLERVVEVGDLLERVPLVPARRDVRRAGVVAVDVLAVEPGVVAGGLQPHGERRHVVERD